ncbi:MAG: DUF4856 domain-containing protein [Chitinophagales bacterium]|nr:DUF4856 domain-containing protein [Chitinophagales bacterium]
MKKVIIPGLAVMALLTTSCNKKENTVIPATSEQKIPYSSLSSSTSYFSKFVDDNGNSTVDFSGQTTRTMMFSEIDAYIKTGTTGTLSAVKLKNMFENKNNPFSDASLNSATDKVISAKTAQSFSATNADAERQVFLGYFAELERISALNGQTAEQGKAGLLGGKRLVDEKGFEYAQFIQKGLMGAMMLDQICNVYLGDDEQSADNTITVEGKNYTALEHHWDEAYGYLTKNEVYPMKDPADATKYLESYLGGYVRQVTAAAGGDPEGIFLAFLKGRAAIVNKDMATRDEQIAYLRTNLEKAVATVAVSYMNKTMAESDPASRFHELSEGTGFVYALRFAHNAKINRVKSDELLNILRGKKDGFWSLTNADLENVRNQIADAFGIDKNVEVNH